jgi:hypothetical protein
VFLWIMGERTATKWAGAAALLGVCLVLVGMVYAQTPALTPASAPGGQSVVPTREPANAPLGIPEVGAATPACPPVPPIAATGTASADETCQRDPTLAAAASAPEQGLTDAAAADGAAALPPIHSDDGANVTEATGQLLETVVAQVPARSPETLSLAALQFRIVPPPRNLSRGYRAVQ